MLRHRRQPRSILQRGRRESTGRSSEHTIKLSSSRHRTFHVATFLERGRRPYFAWLIITLCCCGTVIPWRTVFTAMQQSRPLPHNPTVFRYPSGVLLDENNNIMDLGGLEIEFLPHRRFHRFIHRNQYEKAIMRPEVELSSEESNENDAMALDHDERDRKEKMQRIKDIKDMEKEKSPCQPVEWTLDSFPTCNIIHEVATLDRISPDHFRVKQLGQGGTFRLGFLFSRQYNNNNNKTSASHHDVHHDFVLKVQQIEQVDGESEVLFGRTQMERINAEALMLSHFSSSHRVSNIYGYCGTSVLVERGQDLYHQIIPYWEGQQDDDMRGYISMEDMNQLHHEYDGLYRGNKFTAEVKLEIAIAIMESIALLHGFNDGPITHNDISFDQWLLSMDGRVILNDFNSAVVLRWNAEKERYCKHSEPSGNYKAPEYFILPLFLDEKADVWSLGCILYGILTGVLPYHEFYDDEQYMEQTKRGLPPHLNPAFRNRHQTTFIEHRLVEIMDQMFVADPRERVSIHDVVAQLHETRNANQEHQRRFLNHHRRLQYLKRQHHSHRKH